MRRTSFVSWPILDSTKRLSFARTSEVRAGVENGAFAVPKDRSRDRMVLDARPPNCLEKPETRWIRSLGAISQFLHFFVGPGEVVRLHAEDLREFYHAFRIPRERELRNAFKLRVHPNQVHQLEAFKESFLQCDEIVPCLKTMAMGDLNAVCYGQASHLGVLLQSKLLSLDSFICLKKKPPRSKWFAGLMIDDLIFIEAVPAEDEKKSSICNQIMTEVHKEYQKVGLPRHSGKSVQGSLEGSFWGVQLNGKQSYIRPNLSRAIPLVHLIGEILHLKHATVALLEIISGSLVSIFQLRRRFLSAMVEIYGAQRNRNKNDVIRLSPELRDELFCCISLIVLTYVDFKLSPCPLLLASDASTTAEASVVTEVGAAATNEFHRHALEKGLWSKLLRPEAAYRREKGCLEQWEEMPSETYSIHPLWQEICNSLQFREYGEVIRPRARRHINLGEIDAALKGEVDIGREFPDSFYIHLQDSQVSLGSLVKGRASSFQINRRLSTSIPDHVLYNTRPFYGFVDSAQNPADDPTRTREVRKPAHAPPPWLDQALGGSFELFDEKLKQEGFHPDQLSGLPPEEELLAGATTDFCSSFEAKKQFRRKKGKKQKEKPALLVSEGPSQQGLSCGAKDEDGSRKVEETEDRGREEEAGPAKPDDWGQVVSILLTFRRDQFLFSDRFASLEDALADGPGVLDLFSGSRGHASALKKLGARWILCFDIKHHESEDLSLSSVQQSLVKLTELGAFFAMGAGPVCASFSTAITPPVRTLQYPQGVPWASLLQQQKNLAGNLQLLFILRLVRVCLRKGVVWWVENPDGSWIWRQVGELSWDAILQDPSVGDLRLDYCRFGARWRKRTRFRTSSHLADQRCFCRCLEPHVVLRGRCKQAKMNYTQLAEAYPRGVSRVLAAALLIDSKQIPAERKLDVNACAKFNGARIGEALRPGPRTARPRDTSVRLADVSLLEPGTIAIRNRIWTVFENWRREQFSEQFNSVLLGCPERC